MFKQGGNSILGMNRVKEGDRERVCGTIIERASRELWGFGHVALQSRLVTETEGKFSFDVDVLLKPMFFYFSGGLIPVPELF